MRDTATSAYLGQLRARVPPAHPLLHPLSTSTPLEHICTPLRRASGRSRPCSPSPSPEMPSRSSSPAEGRSCISRTSGCGHRSTLIPPPAPFLGTAWGQLLRFLRAALGGSTTLPRGRGRHCLGCSSELLPKSPIPPPMDRCLLVHPGFGADPLTVRAALLHRRRAAQGTRQAAAAARAAAAACAFVGGPAGAPRQCAALTAHAALMRLKHVSRVLGSVARALWSRFIYCIQIVGAFFTLEWSRVHTNDQMFVVKNEYMSI